MAFTTSCFKDEPHPKPGADSSDREQIVVDGEEVNRLHIGQPYTAFYSILGDESEVRIIELLGIDEVHKRCRF